MPAAGSMRRPTQRSRPGPPVVAPFDWVGVIGSGQSLSVGYTASYLSTTQPFGNLNLVDNGPDPKYPIDTDAGAPQWMTTPLVEPIRASVNVSGPVYDDGQYPNNIACETPHSAMANTLSMLWEMRGGANEHVTTHSVVGWSGNPLVNIDKEGSGRAYPASLNETRVFAQLAAAAGKTFGVGGVVLTHGESDANNPTYGAGLLQYWQDYDVDIKAITGQATDVVLFASQQSVSGGAANSAVQLWQAGVAHPGQIIAGSRSTNTRTRPTTSTCPPLATSDSVKSMPRSSTRSSISTCRGSLFNPTRPRSRARRSSSTSTCRCRR